MITFIVLLLQGAAPDSHEVAREAWQDLKGDVQHALPFAQAKLLQGIQSYYAELDVQSEPAKLSTNHMRVLHHSLDSTQRQHNVAVCKAVYKQHVMASYARQNQLVDAGMLLVDTQMRMLRRPASLPDFLHTQEGHLSDVVDALRSDWLLKVTFPRHCNSSA